MSAEDNSSPEEQSPEAPHFVLDDLWEQQTTYGVDIFPQIESEKDTMRAHHYFLSLKEKWPHFFENLTVGTEFRIDSRFSGPNKNLFPFILHFPTKS
jgi:hypothetical protein